jgi:hypothetical protein
VVAAPEIACFTVVFNFKESKLLKNIEKVIF